MLAASLAAAQPNEAAPEVPFLPEGKPLAGLVITIDPGHGGSPHQEGYHGSARGVNSRVVEGDLNLLVAGELHHYLQFAGATVHMTRLDDRKVTYGPTGRADELGARPNMADETRSHLFLALHHNSAQRRTADGVVVMIWPTDSKGNDQPLERQLADILREEVEKQVHHNEPFKPLIQNHPLVADSDIPSVIVEFGFLSNPEFDAWVSQRGAHIPEARGAYNAVVRMWTEHKAELEAIRAELFPDTVGQKVVPREIPRSAESQFNRLGDQLNPAGQPPATAEEAQHLIDLYKKTELNDSTFFYLNTDITKDDSGWTIKGQANHPKVRDAVARLLETVGCTPLKNEIELLPSDGLGEKRFGVVQIPMAFDWAKPKEQSGVQTQLLLGEPVFLLDISDDGTYLLLQGGEGYIGWVRREAIRELDKNEFAFWMETPRATIRRDVLLDDFRVPAGASLPIVEGGEKTEGKITLKLPKPVRGAGGKDEIQLALDDVSLPPKESAGQRVVETAKEYLTTPYVFGGRSRLGIDCSGLTGVSYAAAGLTLPRDAFQQVIVGRVVATPWYREGLQPGDLVFFIGETGRMFHTGISLGGDRFIHASPPEVQISSFDPKDPLYSKQFTPYFCFARRPLP